MDAAFLQDFAHEMSGDARRVSVAMADTHRRLHRFSRIGWNKCDREPCHSVCVFLGDMAIVAMNIADVPGDGGGAAT